MADDAKARGNSAFSAGKFEEAIKHFSDAIELAGTNHVLYSNRSAAYASLHKYQEALEDTKKTVELKPDWAKGYSRLGAAYVGLNKFQDAVSAYKNGLEYEPNNEALKSGLEDAQASLSKPKAEMWVKLQNDPKTRIFLQQPDFVKMLQDFQRNPSSLNLYMNDPRMMQAIGVLLGMNLQTASRDEMEKGNLFDDEEMPKAEPKQETAEPVVESEPEPMDIPDEEKEKKSRKAEALKEEEVGNAAYRKKDFDAALAHYSRAFELDDEDILYITNRAAVYLEMGKYEECIKDCDKAVERGRELHSDYKMVAKALTRKGTAYVKMAQCSKDYEPAIEAFYKALTEHGNPDTLKKLNDAERIKKELEQKEYFKPTIADEEREKGNELFEEQKYPEATHYSEAIRRNPNDAKACKRQRVEATATEAIAEAKDLLKDLQLLYGNMPEEFLWDTSMFQTLIQPTTCYGDESSREYGYIGRARAKDLLAEMQGLGAGRVLLIQGAKGSGKSTAVCALAGYMLGKMKRKVVYICAARFIANPEEVLQHALLVATECDETVARLTQLEDQAQWCSAHRKDRLMFVVDDWDKFEDFPDQQKALLKIVSYYHILVKLSSTNSRERGFLVASDKARPPFDFDGPYTHEELQTWIAKSSLADAKLKALDCLTGGMPGLLRFYEELEGNRRLFREKIEEPYTSKLFDKLIRLQTTKAQLASAVEMVTTGVQGIHLHQPVDLTCFYKDGDKFKLVSPYLRSRAEYYIMERERELQSGLEYSAIRTWAGAVRMDCIVKGRNPARAGWNVEGLVIAVMRYQKKLWDGLRFMDCKTYEHGCEAALLQTLRTDELSEGLLVAPVAFNEKALDVIYLKLDLETGILTIKAVQITISKWKNKRRKRSHKVWQEEVLPRWLSENWVLEHQFIYVMPEKVNKDELGKIEEDLVSYIAACHARSEDDGEDDEEDGSEDTLYGTEVYEKVDLTKVKSQPIEFKRLGDVHSCLSDFDRFLDLKEPPKLEKKKVVHCGGLVLENGIQRACHRWCCTDEEVYYCCTSHGKQAVERYSEAIRRNPNDVKAYSNRAASYTKLGEFREGLKDANKCIELEPSFIEGYSRKGAIQFFMKEYDKALETYQNGLKHDERNQELLDGISRCVEQINKTSADELKERQAKAMQDPEIQSILSDPVMRQVLSDIQESPKAAQDHMKNPMIMGKIRKLISPGIVQVR